MTSNLAKQSENVFDVLKAFPDSFMKLDPDEQRVSLAIYRALAKGNPVASADIASLSDTKESRVLELLDNWPGVYQDAEGRVVGYWGLAIPEMPHQIQLPDSKVFGWCAWDTLFIPQLIGQTAEVISKSQVSEEIIRLCVSPDGISSLDDNDVYVSFLQPEEEAMTEDVIGSFCHYVYFFASLAEGRSWTASHPGTYLLPLEEAYELGKRKNSIQYADLS